MIVALRLRKGTEGPGTRSSARVILPYLLPRRGNEDGRGASHSRPLGGTLMDRLGAVLLATWPRATAPSEAHWHVAWRAAAFGGAVAFGWGGFQGKTQLREGEAAIGPRDPRDRNPNPTRWRGE